LIAYPRARTLERTPVTPPDSGSHPLSVFFLRFFSPGPPRTLERGPRPLFGGGLPGGKLRCPGELLQEARKPPGRPPCGGSHRGNNLCPDAKPPRASQHPTAPGGALPAEPLRTHLGPETPHWEIEAEKGLPSADRNNKATLLLTGPFRTAKSSAKDLIPRVSKLQYANYHRPLPGRRRNRLLRYEAGAYSYTSTTCGRYHRVLAWILT
jgi:hypothetical protein